MYGYLSQIITFNDIELEKTFVFLKYLNRKLPGRDAEQLDFSDIIDLDSLRIQLTHEEVEALELTDTTLTPPDFEGRGVVEPVMDFLSEIVHQVNKAYGVNLTDEDKLDLSRLSKRLMDNSDVSKYMTNANSEENKMIYFKQQFDQMMLDYVNDRFEFYKKMEDNPPLKNMIFQAIYSDYNKHQALGI